MVRLSCWVTLLLLGFFCKPAQSTAILSVDPVDYVLWHNSYRCLHNSPPVVWDETLASSALTWAQTCNGQHSQGIPYGENLWGDSMYLGTAKEVISFWYDEITLYDWTKGGYQINAGHMTQVVWASTTRIGCAACRNDDTMWRYVVCQYSPAGNAPGFPTNVLPPVKPQSSCFPTPSPKSCVDYPADWADFYGHTCGEYTANHWCENGAVGEGWPSNLPSIAEYWDDKYGLSALNVCCICGGGVRPSAPAASASPVPSPERSPAASASPVPSPERLTTSATSTITSSLTASATSTTTATATSTATSTATFTSTLTASSTSTLTAVDSNHVISNNAGASNITVEQAQPNASVAYWRWIVITIVLVLFIGMTTGLGMWLYQEQQKRSLICLEPPELAQISIPDNHMQCLHPGQVTPVEGFEIEGIMPVYDVSTVAAPASSPRANESVDWSTNDESLALQDDMEKILP